jgi:signal transduction histidine kinase
LELAAAGWHDAHMERRRHRALAWVLWSIAVLLALAAVTFLVLGRSAPAPSESFGFRGFSALFALVFGTTGLVIASRVPSNPIGWLFLAAGVGSGLQELAQQYAIYGIVHRPGSLPGADVGAWIVQWIWVPLTALAIVFVPMLYPTGRLLSGTWRLVVWAATLLILADALAFALAPGPIEEFRAVENPIGVRAAPWLMEAAEIGLMGYLLGLGAALWSLVIRFRRSPAEERLQLKWLLLAGAIATLALMGMFVMQIATGSPPKILEYLIVLSIAAIPVAVGVAVLRYRLYDIDLVIKKTVVYAVLALLLFLLGVVPAWATAGLVVDLTGSGEFSWLLAGLVVGIAIWPLRRLATRIADRIVFGRRATPYEVLSEFSDRVAETYAADDVLERMARVLAAGVGAEAATVWLRDRGGFHPAASWPADDVPEGDLPPSAVEVRYRDEPLGALSVRMPPNDPMDPTKERLIRDLAGQAGLVLRNAALIDDLRASRQRLVAAQDAERRRIERNIHDGAQQQLVALAVKLGLAERVLSSNADRAATMLAEAKAETNDALETLRDLARGIYPPLLADEGLAAAITAQARKSALPVSVETDGIGRYPQETEAAVYFSCLEALQNVAKHAGATSASIRLRHENGNVTFEITDDGRGFDPAVSTYGTGLQGMADRLAALGGALSVRSAPGTGTTIAGAVPVEARS